MEQPSSPPETGGKTNPEYVPVIPDDGINNPPEDMLRRFWINLGLVVAAVVLLLLALNFAANHLTRFIPFSWEKRLSGDVMLQASLDARGKAKQAELRRLAARLSKAADLPEGMDVTLYYNPRKVKNAFATFGGNIVVFDGLLDLIESEDGLAMVLAHEIMHIKHRDAIKGLIRAAGLILLSSGLQSGNFVDGVVNLGVSGYSREQEEAADLEAVAVLGKAYGHAGGAGDFFRSLAGKVERRDADGAGHEMTAVASTHPDTVVRLRRAMAEADRLGIPESGKLTPIPDVLDNNQVFIDARREFDVTMPPRQTAP